MLTVKDTAFDFTEAQKISDKERLTGAIDAGGRPGIDHAFIINDANPDVTHAMHHCATLKSVESGISMKVESTQPSVVVYTTNFVDKSDTKHTTHAAICLETCQLPDAINKIGVDGFPKRPVLRQGGENYSHITIHTFSS